MKKRLFIGIPVSADDSIFELINRLKSTNAALSLVPVDNLHFTLKFLGDLGENKIAELEAKLELILKAEKKFEISLDGVGIFPDLQYLKVIWIGSKTKQLNLLMGKIHACLNDIRKEDYKEIPHLTIARVKSGKNKQELQEIVNEFKEKSFGRMVVDRIILYESVLTEKGSVYKIEKEFKWG